MNAISSLSIIHDIWQRQRQWHLRHIWSEWCGDMTWATKLQWQWQIQRQRHLDLFDNFYNSWQNTLSTVKVVLTVFFKHVLSLSLREDYTWFRWVSLTVALCPVIGSASDHSNYRASVCCWTLLRKSQGWIRFSSSWDKSAYGQDRKEIHELSWKTSQELRMLSLSLFKDHTVILNNVVLNCQQCIQCLKCHM